MAEDERPGSEPSGPVVSGGGGSAAPGDPGLAAGLPGLEQLVEVGRGGFAVVYRAWQAAFNRHVAAKVISVLVDEGTLKRFERECLAVGALSGHPAIVTVHELGRTPEGRPYIVMEYLERGSVAGYLAEHGPFDPSAVLDMGVKVAGALESAHRIGVLHRDIKPENVLLSRFGEPKLADFGIASVAGRTETRSGSITASVAHAAPEIMNGERPTVASDVYSLASTLYTLLAGTAAFVREGDDSILPIVARIAVAPVPDLRPGGVPDSICRVVEAGMAKLPGDRPASALELARRLQEAQAGLDLPITPLLVETEPGTDPVPPRLAAAVPPAAGKAAPRAGPTAVRPIPFGPGPGAGDGPGPEPATRRRSRTVLAASGLLVVVAVGGWLATRSSPSPSPSPSDSAAAVVFQDDFSSAASGWATGQTNTESLTYSGGRYVFRVDTSPYTQITDTYFEGDGYRDALTRLADVSVEVTAFPGDNADAGFGLMCRGHYLAFVTSGGAWSLQRQGAGAALKAGTATLDGSGPRRLRLDCLGAENGPVTLTLAVDGRTIGQVVDPTGLGPGSVGLAVTTTTGPFEVAFDDFVVRQL